MKENTEKSRYATKKRGATEVDPIWNLEDVKNMILWFKNHEEWDGYLTFMLGILLGRRIGDTMSIKWSDLYYENGRERSEIRTLKEQKTGKTTVIPISKAVFTVVKEYCEHTGIVPSECVNDYVFMTPSKLEWINRKESSAYKENNLELWCKFLNKDFTEGRKKEIEEGFEKQKEYATLGEYLYNVVERDDVEKWQTDGFRKRFKKAAKECGINYSVSCHSLRKTFGYISKIIHPGDPNALETLQEIFNHATPAVTLKYIGLSSKRKQMYFEDIGETILKAEQGDTEIRIDDSPVISFKQDDFRKVIKWVIEDNEHSDIEKLNMALDMADKLRIKYL